MQFLTQEELKHLFAVITDTRAKALFFLAYRHGLRASEIGLLQRSDVDLKQERITIQRLKGSLSGISPLQPDVIKLLRSSLRARTDAFRRTLWCAMQTYGKKAGVPLEKRKFHSLKHSIATHLLDARGELRSAPPMALRVTPFIKRSVIGTPPRTYLAAQWLFAAPSFRIFDAARRLYRHSERTPS